MPENSPPARFAGFTRRDWVKKIVVFVLTIVVLSWVYAWASPRAFPQDRTLGFGYGVLHGGLMPMAMPSLVTGHNVEIFASNNSGRTYKMGYIVGINICGLLVFGSFFWKPKQRPQ